MGCNIFRLGQWAWSWLLNVFFDNLYVVSSSVTCVIYTLSIWPVGIYLLVEYALAWTHGIVFNFGFARLAICLNRRSHSVPAQTVFSKDDSIKTGYYVDDDDDVDRGDIETMKALIELLAVYIGPFISVSSNRVSLVH